MVGMYELIRRVAILTLSAYEAYKLWASARFFFFQAEDGIRDVAVTGVQTCALPIFAMPRPAARPPPAGRPSRAPRAPKRLGRSEERRVGKEGRSRWSPDH